MSRIRPVRVLASVALSLLAACATGAGSARPEAGGEVVVQVQNDLVPARSLTVRLVSSQGRRTLLGSVAPGETRSLRVREPNFHGSFRLVAGTGSGEDITSNLFTLSPNETVVWQVRANIVRVSGG